MNWQHDEAGMDWSETSMFISSKPTDELLVEVQTSCRGQIVSSASIMLGADAVRELHLKMGRWLDTEAEG